LAPYTVEQYGVSLGSRSSGLGQAANRVGKIFGPLALAVLAGSDNIIAPKATADAVFLAFVFLAATMLVALAFALLGSRRMADRWRSATSRRNETNFAGDHHRGTESTEKTPP
jgi:MFS transporter, putative metabolite:H+ symporter